MSLPQPAASSANQQVIENIYKSFQQGRPEDVLAACHADIVWSSTYSPAVVPLGGEFRGHDGVRRFFISIGSHLQVQVEVHQYVTQGDTVVAIGMEHVTHLATSRKAKNPFVHVYTLREGKVSTARIYGDTAVISDLFQPGR